MSCVEVGWVSSGPRGSGSQPPAFSITRNFIACLQSNQTRQYAICTVYLLSCAQICPCGIMAAALFLLCMCPSIHFFGECQRLLSFKTFHEETKPCLCTHSTTHNTIPTTMRTNKPKHRRPIRVACTNKLRVSPGTQAPSFSAAPPHQHHHGGHVLLLLRLRLDRRSRHCRAQLQVQQACHAGHHANVLALRGQ